MPAFAGRGAGSTSSVADGKVEVELELAARYGTVLPELARTCRQASPTRCGRRPASTSTRVDVSVEELDA